MARRHIQCREHGRWCKGTNGQAGCQIQRCICGILRILGGGDWLALWLSVVLLLSHAIFWWPELHFIHSGGLDESALHYFLLTSLHSWEREVFHGGLKQLSSRWTPNSFSSSPFGCHWEPKYTQDTATMDNGFFAIWIWGTQTPNVALLLALGRKSQEVCGRNNTMLRDSWQGWLARIGCSTYRQWNSGVSTCVNLWP